MAIPILGNLTLPDNTYLKLGTGNDAAIVHDGTNTTIFGTTLKIGRQETDTSNREIIDFSVDGKVVICVDGTEYRFRAAALNPGTDNARDLGSSVKQWQDLYLGGDLHVAGSILQGAAGSANIGGGNAYDFPLAENDNFAATLPNDSCSIALTVTSSDVGKSGMIVLTNPASTGSLSIAALPSYMLTPGGATLNFVTTANAISIISYYVHATDKVLVNYVGNFA
tara:strand:+ start:4133 stop:4804 length:672 start_codon:yes stop_codon:yes gene_type:complete